MELYWINDFVAVATRPRGRDWLRDDLAAAQQRGVRTVVSCLTREEESELGLEGELDAAQSLGLEFARIAIEDQGTPQPGLVGEMLSRIRRSATPQTRIAISLPPRARPLAACRCGDPRARRNDADRGLGSHCHSSGAACAGDRRATSVANSFRCLVI